MRSVRFFLLLFSVGIFLQPYAALAIIEGPDGYTEFPTSGSEPTQYQNTGNNPGNSNAQGYTLQSQQQFQNTGNNPGNPNASGYFSSLLGGGGDATLVGDGGGLVTCEGPECNWCHFVSMVNRIITWLIAMLSIFAVIMLMIAGFRMVTSGGNKAAWDSAKKSFTKVVVGIIIVLASYLIVDTLLVTLTDKGGINKWLPSDCGGPLGGDLAGGGGSPSTPATPGGGAAAGRYTDAEARAKLAAAGISVNKTIAEGTSLQNVNQATIDRIVALRNECGCTFTVTGGTEGGHAGGAHSHGTGYKIDLRPNATLNSHITSNYTRCGTRGGYCDSAGNEYVRENAGRANDHWDILVN